MTDKSRVESVELIYNGAVVRLQRETLQLPNGNHAVLEIVRHPGGAATVALDERGQVCLIRQFRHAVDTWLWELPAGKLEPDEPPRITAARELQEEAGILAADWESLGSIVSSPAIFDERIYLYLARDLEAVPHEHEPEENIEIHWFPLPRALQMIVNNEIVDSKTVTGLLRARLHAETRGKTGPGA